MTMEYITDMLSRFVSTVSSIDIKDVIDMILLTYCVYKGIKLVRETKAQQLLVGILIVVAVYIVVSELELKAMSYLSLIHI